MQRVGRTLSRPDRSTDSRARGRPGSTLRRALAVAGVVIVVGLVAFLAWPLDTQGLASQPAPAASYGDAMARVQGLQAADGAEVNPLCATRLLTHGMKVDRAVVLFQGYTDCVAQWGDFAQLLYDEGYNVLVPRAPRHGLIDNDSNELGQLTARELVRRADEAADIAHGLGDSVSVMGFSMGGVMAGVLAQQRPDIDRAVVIAPGFVLGGIPPFAAGQVAKALLLAPNVMFCRGTCGTPDPPYAFPRQCTRAIAAILQLGAVVRDEAQRRAPAAGSVVLVTNANDDDVDNGVAREVAAAWQHRAPDRVATYEFPKALGLIHDVVDPIQSGSRTDVVYPVLLRLLQAD